MFAYLYRMWPREWWRMSTVKAVEGEGLVLGHAELVGRHMFRSTQDGWHHGSKGKCSGGVGKGEGERKPG